MAAGAQILEIKIDFIRPHLQVVENSLGTRQADRDSYVDLVNRASGIEAAHREWQRLRKEHEKLDRVASEFHEYEKERSPLLEKIAVEKARLEQELEGLAEQEKVISEQSPLLLTDY